MIYLDNAATTYPKPNCVYEALDNANRNLAFNAGRGSYDLAKQISNLIQETREKVASLVNGKGEMVAFQSSATEALNMIINGLGLSKGDTVYISPFEHNAVIRPLYNLKEKVGIEIKILPFDKITWDIDEQQMNDMFAINKPKACFLTQISNVTGFILPVGVIFAKTKDYNCINVLDSSQSLGILNPDVNNVDFVVFAGHKSLYASFGVAGFINVTHKKLEITKSGGTGSDSLNPYMPESGFQRYESGSLNSIAIIGLNESLNWLRSNRLLEREIDLTKYLEERLSDIEKVHIFKPEESNCLLGIISIAVEGYSAQDVGSILNDEFQICVRTGYHCAAFLHDFISSVDYGGTVRISVGAFTKYSEIDELINALKTF